MPVSRFSRQYLLLLLVLAVPLGACGGGGTGSGANPAAPTARPSTTAAPQPGPPVVTYYSGVLATQTAGGGSGALTLRATVQTTLVNGAAQQEPTGAVTGLLNTIDGAQVTLYGTLTPASSLITLAGGGYQLTATTSPEGTLNGSGTYTGAAGLAPHVNALAAGATAVSITALPTKPGLPGGGTRTFCGGYSGQYVSSNGKNNESEAGGVCIAITDSRVAGSAPTSGEIAPGSPSTIAFSGTAFGDITNWSLTASATGGGDLRLDGRYALLTARWSGSYRGSDGQGLSNGTWYASNINPPEPTTIPPDKPEVVVGGKGVSSGTWYAPGSLRRSPDPALIPVDPGSNDTGGGLRPY